MTKRLQVLLDDEELADFQRLAKRRRMTTAEWVRRSLRAAREADAGADVGQKLAAVRRAAAFGFPTANVGTMLDEIEQGYREPGASS
jgi:hypothetical protein